MNSHEMNTLSSRLLAFVKFRVVDRLSSRFTEPERKVIFDLSSLLEIESLGAVSAIEPLFGIR